MNHYYLTEGSKRNNLGDLIQGLAAREFLNETAICLNREELNSFKGKDGLLIANGWFMHNYSAFPPSGSLKPLFIGFHLASIKLLSRKGNRDYFRKFAPIGCRDKRTLWMFILNGIPAYYSGCLTLTYKDHSNESSDLSAIPRYRMVDNVDHPFPPIIKQKIKQLIGEEADLLNHDPIEVKNSFEEYTRINELRILEIFKLYKASKLVITNKLHCALPCIALGIKVLFIHPNPKDARLEILKRLIKIFSYNEVLTWDKIPEQPIKYKHLRKIQNQLVLHTNFYIRNGKSIWSDSKDIKLKLNYFVVHSMALLLSPIGALFRIYKFGIEKNEI